MLATISCLEVSQKVIFVCHFKASSMTTAQLAKEFEQSRGQLKSYILRLTASVADAEDI